MYPSLYAQVGIPPYMPPCVYQVGSPLCLPGYTAVVLTTNTVMFDTGFNTFNPEVREERVLQGKEGLFLPQNKPSSSQEP